MIDQAVFFVSGDDADGRNLLEYCQKAFAQGMKVEDLMECLEGALKEEADLKSAVALEQMQTKEFRQWFAAKLGIM